MLAIAGGQFEVHILAIETQLEGPLTPYFSSQPYAPGTLCQLQAPMHGYGQAEMVSSYSFSLDGYGVGDSNSSDPAFLDDLVLTGPGPLEDCFYPVVAVAPLTWNLPDMRPNLVVVDSGTTGGATGTVEMVDGTPRSYEVASGDLLAEIAARFGIQVADLFYLNPA